MRYQQTPLSRLRGAAKKFVADGQWHSSAEEQVLFYRIHGKTVQRLRLETGEAEGLLDLFRDFEPLPSRILKEGFREELCFRVVDDHYELCGLLVRAYVGWDMLAAAAAQHGITVTFLGGNSLQASVRIDEWKHDDVSRALIRAKAFTRLASQLAIDAKEGIPHIDTEVRGLLRSACELYMESLFRPVDSGEKKNRHPDQTSLFPD